MKTKVRGTLPTDFYFGLDEVEKIINHRVMPIIADGMRKDHHFTMDSKGKVRFYPFLDTEEPMSFTTSINALVDEAMGGDGMADQLIKVLQSAIRRVKRNHR